MRWYINDTSLQGQYNEADSFLALIGGLISAKNRLAPLRVSLHTTRTLGNRIVGANRTLREFVRDAQFRDFRAALFQWMDKTGPFIEDDRQPELDDYFECLGHDVTDAGLGEAARRAKYGGRVTSFSFPGGPTDFCVSPLAIEHGLAEQRLGAYGVVNVWTLADLARSVQAARPEPSSWREMVEHAREDFPRLIIADALYGNSALAREPFDAVVCDRARALMKYLDDYMAGRTTDGAEGPSARAVIDQFFVGDRALFSAESDTNQQRFGKELTFRDPLDPNKSIFAHWHGKISHRFFRMHFEWPVPAVSKRLKIVYLGPKITKT